MMTLTRRRMMEGTAVAALAGLLGVPGALAGTPQVLNETSGVVLHDLFTAIAAAKPGDMLVVSGRHIGQFTLDKSLTLRGDGSAVIDAGGQGSALTITADGATIEGLTLTGSGRAGVFALRRPAGVLVSGHRVTLTGLTATGNDTGVAFVEARDGVLTGAQIADNHSEGVSVMGGQGHRIASCAISGNDIGVLIGPCYGEFTEAPRVIPPFDNTDQEAVKRYGEELQREKEFFESMAPASDITVAECTLPGNGGGGISVGKQSRRIALQGNTVTRTGRDRPPNAEALAAATDYFTAVLGGVEPNRHLDELLGAGIAFTCVTEDNRVIENVSDDNLGAGLYLNMTYRTEVADNRFARNRTGAWLADADNNVVTANTLAENAEYGLIIDSLMNSNAPAPDGSTGNLITANSLTGNGTNAYDSSDWTPTRAEVEARWATAAWPKQVRDQMSANPALLEQAIAQQMTDHSPGHNRWDDGTLGNHYDDFDETPEGFRDGNGDGVGEVAHPIPGGGHVDRYPLTAARVAAI